MIVSPHDIYDGADAPFTPRAPSSVPKSPPAGARLSPAAMRGERKSGRVDVFSAFLVTGGGDGEVGAGAGVFFEGALEVELLGDLSGGGDDLLAEQAQAAH